MIGTPFYLGPDERQQLEALREEAAKAPVDMEVLRDRISQPDYKRRHMRQMTGQSVMLPFGFLVTFSIETNHPGRRTARHMSMSSPAEGRAPTFEAVWMVAETLGFTGQAGIENAEANLKFCDRVWMEELQGHGKAVNVVQLIRAEAAHAENGRARQ